MNKRFQVPDYCEAALRDLARRFASATQAQ